MSSPLDVNKLFRVDGMVAVVTGGGTGIGLMMAKALAVNGASKVYILGRRLEVLESAANGQKGLIPVQCDVTSKASLQSAVDRVTSEAGLVNLLIANSGVLGPAMNWNPSKSVSELRQAMFEADTASLQDMTDTFHVNVSAAMFTLFAFLELLEAGNKNALKGGFGAPAQGKAQSVPSVQSQVVFTSSIAAYSRHYLSSPSYSGSKAAIMHLTKQAATAMASYGIRANALAPGLFPSELASGLIGQRKPEEEGPDNPKFIPLQRFGCDEEMAGSILYLASRAGAFCDGLILMMDGGRVSVMPSTY